MLLPVTRALKCMKQLLSNQTLLIFEVKMSSCQMTLAVFPIVIELIRQLEQELTITIGGQTIKEVGYLLQSGRNKLEGLCLLENQIYCLG